MYRQSASQTPPAGPSVDKLCSLARGSKPATGPDSEVMKGRGTVSGAVESPVGVLVLTILSCVCVLSAAPRAGQL